MRKRIQFTCPTAGQSVILYLTGPLAGQVRVRKRGRVYSTAPFTANSLPLLHPPHRGAGNCPHCRRWGQRLWGLLQSGAVPGGAL